MSEDPQRPDVSVSDVEALRVLVRTEFKNLHGRIGEFRRETLDALGQRPTKAEMESRIEAAMIGAILKAAEMDQAKNGRNGKNGNGSASVVTGSPPVQPGGSRQVTSFIDRWGRLFAWALFFGLTAGSAVGAYMLARSGSTGGPPGP